MLVLARHVVEVVIVRQCERFRKQSCSRSERSMTCTNAHKRLEYLDVPSFMPSLAFKNLYQSLIARNNVMHVIGTLDTREQQ
jgi:hypothetical protein